jgi:hypothetical protein
VRRPAAVAAEIEAGESALEPTLGTVLMCWGRGAEENNQGNNLHISGLARVIDNRMLEDLFSKVGKVRSGKIYRLARARRSALVVGQSSRAFRSTRLRSCSTLTLVRGLSTRL